MNTLIHADVFFFITSIVVVFFGILGVVFLYYAIKTARSAFSIAETIRKESENVAEDIAAIREKVRDQGLKVILFKELMKKIFSVGAYVKKTSDSRKRSVHKAEKHSSRSSEDEE